MPTPERVCLLIVLSAVCVGHALAVPTHESAAHVVPADIGLFVEGQHLDDVLLALTEPQAWLAIAELAGQPAGVEETTQWRARVRQTVRMEPAEAIRVLFSEQFAFVGERPGRAQDAVVLCRPQVDRKELLQRWQAQPLPTAGRTSVYRLPGRVGLALPHDLLMFGDAAPTDGMFRHVLEFADAEPGAVSLAEDPVYSGLLARVPENPDAVLFARLRSAENLGDPAPEAGASPRAELPGPLRGAANILLALHREDGLLHFSAVGDSRVAPNPDRTGLPELVARLPERTLLAWGLHLDYAALVKAIDTLPQRSILRITFKLQQRSGTLARLTSALGSATTLAVGVVEPRTRTKPAPPVPALAVMVNTPQPETVAQEVGTLIEATRSIYNLMSLKVGSRPVLLSARPVQIDATRAMLLDLTQLIQGQPGAEAIAELHVCWAVDGDTLIVASHIDWLRQILAARHGQAPPLAGVLARSRRPIAATSETVIALQPGPISDLSELWLAYFALTAPQVLSQDWWRQRQPGGENVQLGIQVTEVPDERRLRVTSVAPDTPADGLLRPGDDIVGYHKRRFATTQPVREVRTAINNRPNARWIDLLVERGGTTLPKRVPLPFVDPVQMLRRAVAIGKLAQRAVYHDDVPDEAGARGFLTIELRQTQRPLFPFSLTPSAAPVVGQTPNSP